MDYQNGKIYYISNGELYYVGSTVQGLKERLRGHRNDYNSYEKSNHYKSSFEVIKTGTYEIKLIENFPCECKADLEKREYEIIKEYNALYGDKCVNILGVQTAEQYAQKQRDRSNLYYAEHKAERKEKMRQSYANNKEQRIAQVKAYREANHAEIMARLLTPVECECGDVVAKCNLTRHKKSQRHLTNINK
tara:strand:- start:3170 stop:3742 length:573 start_codon:yes stop_codon:yes gene_type:complete